MALQAEALACSGLQGFKVHGDVFIGGCLI